MDFPFLVIVSFVAACIYGVGVFCGRSSFITRPQGEGRGLNRGFGIDNRPEDPSPYDNPAREGFWGRYHSSAAMGVAGRRGVDEINDEDNHRSAFDDDDPISESVKNPNDLFAFGDGLLGSSLDDSIGSSIGIDSVSGDDSPIGGSSIGGGIGDDIGGGMIGDDSI